MRPRRLWVWSAAFCGLVLSGCLSPRSDPSQFYLLAPMATAPPADGTAAFSVGVGPVTLPAYLDRPQMVTRVAPNQLELSEVHRWAESLRSNFQLTVAENLAALLGTGRVLSYPWHRTEEPTYTVVIDVLRFEREVDWTVVLHCRWYVTDSTTGVRVASGERDYAETSPVPDVAASVQAMSGLVERLSRELAEAVRQAASP